MKVQLFKLQREKTCAPQNVSQGKLFNLKLMTTSVIGSHLDAIS